MNCVQYPQLCLLALVPGCMHVIGCMASAGSGEVGREALRRAQAAAAQALNPSLASTVTASTAPGYAHRQSFSARRTDEASQLPAATQRQGLLLILLVLLFHWLCVGPLLLCLGPRCNAGAGCLHLSTGPASASVF